MENREIKQFTEEQLVTELMNRGYDSDDFAKAVYVIEEMAGHRDDVIFGSSEAGLHGKSQGEAKNVQKPATGTK